MPLEPIIKIKDLNVTYFFGRPNEVKALKNINLEIYPGEFVVFFGPSGCGKSTLLYSISGLEMNTFGSIIVNNKDIAKMKKGELEKFHQRQTGMIFQSFYLINSLNILQNVCLPQIAVDVNKSDREKKAMELMQRFGIGEQGKKLPTELSGGQQQRVAICRALVNDPEILFADEPVGNLDSKSSAEVMKLLKELNEGQKKTIILVTHNPAHLDMAHRIFYLRDGEVIDTKVNKDVKSAEESTGEDGDAEGKEAGVKGGVSISKDLELLARTFSNLSGIVGNLLVPFKAKEIVSEVLTNLSPENLQGLEDKVACLLSRGAYGEEELFDYLDKEVEQGGLGFDKRVAESLAEKIKTIVGEIRELQKEENPFYANDYSVAKEAAQVRDYLASMFDLKNLDSVLFEKMAGGVRDRLENRIDRNGFEKFLDLPVKKGGVGLDHRRARKIALHLELLVLGKLK